MIFHHQIQLFLKCKSRNRRARFSISVLENTFLSSAARINEPEIIVHYITYSSENRWERTHAFAVSQFAARCTASLGILFFRPTLTSAFGASSEFRAAFASPSCSSLSATLACSIPGGVGVARRVASSCNHLLHFFRK